MAETNMTNSNETSRPKRSKYTDEFKDQIRSEAQGKYDNETIVKLAKKHQIPRGTIRNWLLADSQKPNEQQETTINQSPQFKDRSSLWQQIFPIIILLAIIVIIVFIFKPLVHIIYILLVLALVISFIAGFFLTHTIWSSICCIFSFIPDILFRLQDESI
ncbi:hypothetical protein [Desulfosporosinus sp. BG]|uniref:hypothetical protein n=1 Tax=Desulfosporosinus sp. BG TaxID=1633135 RepID=UPI00083BA254|nr:hypothetical protein [Desulfosporosinus sp. BG]